jgi:hypothetical protein
MWWLVVCHLLPIEVALGRLPLPDMVKVLIDSDLAGSCPRLGWNPGARDIPVYVHLQRLLVGLRAGGCCGGDGDGGPMCHILP